MSLVAGQPVKAAVDNAAFVSKINDSDMAGVLGLKNAGSGALIANVQQYINKMADILGDVSEGGSGHLDYSSVNYITDGMTHKDALEALDAQLKLSQDQIDDHETRLLAAEASILDHEARITQNESDIATHETRLDGHDLDISGHETRLDNLETANMTIGGNKTFSGDVVVQGNFEVQGTLTAINSTNLEVEDALITANKNGTNGTADGAGLEVERPAGNGQILFDSTLDSKWKVGVVGFLYEVIVSGIAQTISGIKDFVSGIKTDSVNESTLNSGVTVDGVLIKDGLVDGRDVSADGTDLDNHILDATVHFTEGSISHLNIQHIGTNSHADIDSHIADVLTNPHSVTKTQVGLGNVTDDAQLKRAAGDFDTFSEKLLATANDLILIEDSLDSLNKKKVKISNLPSGGGGGSSPIGTVVDYAGSAAPSGWLLCDGSAIDRAVYSALFATIGVVYGSGDGSTTFNLPDARGRVSVGRDDMGGVAAGLITVAGSGINGANLGAFGGSQTHLLTAAQSGVPAHAHSITDVQHDHAYVSGLGGGGLNTRMSRDAAASGAAGAGIDPAFTGITGTNNNTAANASQAHLNVQPSIIFNKIIKY